MVSPVATRSRWWADPFVWGFGIIAVAAYIVSSYESAEWLSMLVLYGVIAAGCLCVWYCTRKSVPGMVDTARNSRQGWAALGWYAAFIVTSMATGGGGIFGNEFMKYAWFVMLPVALVFLSGGRGTRFRDVLRSIGFRREGLGKSLLLAVLAYAIAFIGIILFLPDSQLDKLHYLAQSPLKMLLVVPLSFGFALVTAAFTEEVFFRGIIQSRLAVMMKSDVHACLVTALLFGLYHLPYAFFMDSWPTYGNLPWALSSVIAEQAVTGLILGVLWARTRSLAAPVLFHALVNTLAMMTMFN